MLLGHEHHPRIVTGQFRNLQTIVRELQRLSLHLRQIRMPQPHHEYIPRLIGFVHRLMYHTGIKHANLPLLPFPFLIPNGQLAPLLPLFRNHQPQMACQHEISKIGMRRDGTPRLHAREEDLAGGYPAVEDCAGGLGEEFGVFVIPGASIVEDECGPSYTVPRRIVGQRSGPHIVPLFFQRLCIGNGRHEFPFDRRIVRFQLRRPFQLLILPILFYGKGGDVTARVLVAILGRRTGRLNVLHVFVSRIQQPPGLEDPCGWTRTEAVCDGAFYRSREGLGGEGCVQD
mmetsp:Transcript_15486/g.17830  ORF Transcript_15486/g.17830 Transcript_15486/m.17830 type:complete len:286 (-) Transcript_15486:214-1071(-)